MEEAPIVHGSISCSVIRAGPWDIQDDGHIIPNANASFDIGNAEYKVRHLFLSDNSITVGNTVLSESTLKIHTIRFQAPESTLPPVTRVT